MALSEIFVIYHSFLYGKEFILMKKNPTSLFLDRKEIKKLLLESALIVFSVLLALFINRTAENIKIRNQKRAALEKIYKEVYNNNAITQEWQARHQVFLGRIKKIVSDKNDTLRTVLLQREYIDIDLITNGKGMASNLMSSTAWDAAKSTQIISEFDYETVEVLTTLYQSQAITIDALNKLVELYYDNSVYSNEEGFQKFMLKFQLYFTELLIQERNLIQQRYKEALKALQPYATAENED